MIYDVRVGDTHVISEILFADEEDSVGSTQACKITPEVYQDSKYSELSDATGEQVLINSVDHAKNLIKALEKAIELGWLE